MMFSPYRTATSRALFVRFTSSITAELPGNIRSSKRSTASGALPPPKLDYAALAQPDQYLNANHRNASIPDKVFTAIRRDLDAWRITTRGADDLRARQARAGEAVRMAKSAEGKLGSIQYILI